MEFVHKKAKGDFMYDINAIKNYIVYLKTKCNLSVSFHMRDYNDLFKTSDLFPFSFQDNSYCIYVKTCTDAYSNCCLEQNSDKLKCQNGPLQKTCYAGVKKYVYPIYSGNDVIGMVCVSGYQCKNPTHYLNFVSRKFDLDSEKLSAFYRTLKTKIPPKNEIDTLIHPLCEMLELSYIQSQEKAPTSRSFAERVMYYLNTNHTKKISSKDVCERFCCSRSYMSREFNRYTGKTLREYLTELRIKDALVLLESSSLSVSEIAYSVGFDDSNYFSIIFKAKVGMSPREYRKKRTL